jgi:hypothetical protein
MGTMYGSDINADTTKGVPGSYHPFFRREPLESPLLHVLFVSRPHDLCWSKDPTLMKRAADDADYTEFIREICVIRVYLFVQSQISFTSPSLTHPRTFMY